MMTSNIHSCRLPLSTSAANTRLNAPLQKSATIMVRLRS